MTATPIRRVHGLSVATFALLACGASALPSPGEDGGDVNAAPDRADVAASRASDTPPVCSYPPDHNDAACPAAYSYTLQGQACASVGLACVYAGDGDGLADGCFATAMAWCRAGDGGAGRWTVAQ